MRKAINLVAILKKEIFLVSEGDGIWTLPGGKPEKNEDDLSCLIREMGEELPGTRFSITDYLGRFEGLTPRRGDILESFAYLGEIDLPWKTGMEIKEAGFFSYTNLPNVSGITKKIINSLKRENYL